MEYEYIADGWMFTKYNIRVNKIYFQFYNLKYLKVLVYKIDYTEIIGNYAKDNLKPLTDSFLVEATIMLPDGQPHDKAAKMLREFADQLLP